MEYENINIELFSEGRHRETHLRRSVVAIDDTDYLIEVKNARRRSIVMMAGDDTGIPNSNSAELKQIWNQFAISPSNIRNMLSGGKGRDSGSEVEEEKTSSNPIPDLPRGKNENATTVTPSSSEELLSPISSSSLQETSSSSLAPSPSSSSADKSTKIMQYPKWFNKLGAISQRERQQEKAYHDTLDEHHEARMRKAMKQKKNHPYWRRRNSSRDGLDFSRDVALALRHNSIYAMADSMTQLPSFDAFDIDSNILNIDERNKADNSNNGYVQDTRPAANPKTKKCVLDLIT